MFSKSLKNMHTRQKRLC